MRTSLPLGQRCRNCATTGLRFIYTKQPLRNGDTYVTYVMRMNGAAYCPRCDGELDHQRAKASR